MQARAEAKSEGLAGKVALITGGASGIGRATALRFGQEGAAVAIFDRERTPGQAAIAELAARGARAIFVEGDVTRASDCQGAIERVAAELGGLDVLFNNAGIIRRATITELREEDWDRVMNVNVKGIFLMSKFAVPRMANAGGGSIINMGSGWSLAAGPRAAVYCASKGAVLQLTRAMAIDHGPQKIRVNCLCPGDTDTPMLRDEARQIGRQEDEFLSASAHRPLQRIATPQDIARAALYLASDASAFVTGTAFVVDGGGLA